MPELVDWDRYESDVHLARQVDCFTIVSDLFDFEIKSLVVLKWYARDQDLSMLVSAMYAKRISISSIPLTSTTLNMIPWHLM